MSKSYSFEDVKCMPDSSEWNRFRRTPANKVICESKPLKCATHIKSSIQHRNSQAVRLKAKTVFPTPFLPKKIITISMKSLGKCI
eukprot:6393906-Amphidinium_carterae.3